MVETGDNDHRNQEGCKHHHQQTDAIHPEFKTYSQRGKPVGSNQQIAVAGGLIGDEGSNCQSEFSNRASQCDLPDCPFLPDGDQDQRKRQGK